MKALPGRKDEIGQAASRQKASPYFAPIDFADGLRQRQNREKGGIDGEAFQDKVPGDKNLDQQAVKRAVGQYRGSGGIPGRLPDQRQRKKETAQGRQKIDSAVALPISSPGIGAVHRQDSKEQLEQ